MDKIAVAGYMKNTNKLQLKIMTLDEAVYLVKSHRHFDYTPEQLDKLKKDIVNPKGYFISFNEVMFRMLKVD